LSEWSLLWATLASTTAATRYEQRSGATDSFYAAGRPVEGAM